MELHPVISRKIPKIPLKVGRYRVVRRRDVIIYYREFFRMNYGLIGDPEVFECNQCLSTSPVMGKAIRSTIRSTYVPSADPRIRSESVLPPSSSRPALMGDYAVLQLRSNALIRMKNMSQCIFCMTGRSDCPDISFLTRNSCFRRRSVSCKEGVLENTGLRILIIEGECPSGENHETIEC